MKIFYITLVLIVLFSAQIVGAVAREPGVAPLQPLPADITPNYSGSVQSGSGAEDAKEGDSEYYAVPDEELSEEDGGIEESLGLTPVEASDTLITLLVAFVVLGSAGIAGLYYWYKKRKEK